MPQLNLMKWLVPKVHVQFLTLNQLLIFAILCLTYIPVAILAVYIYAYHITCCIASSLVIVAGRFLNSQCNQPILSDNIQDLQMHVIIM